MSVTRRKDRDHEWWVTIHWHGKRLRKRSPVQTKRAAQAYERTLLSEFSEDTTAGRDPLAGPPPTFVEFSERWMKEYVRSRNRPASQREKDSRLRVHLLPAFGHQRLDDIRTSGIDAFVADRLAGGLSRKSVNNLLTVLRCALSTAVEWGCLRSVPRIRWLRVPTPTFRYLSHTELDRLMAATKPGLWRTLITFLAHTGCRFGEAAALRWEDIDWSGPVPIVHIRRAASLGVIGPTKTGRPRDIPLNDTVASTLKAYRHSGGLVFATPSGEVLRPDKSANSLKRIAVRAGLAPFGWHVLRHTFATLISNTGAPLRAVQELLGHSTIVMTARYAHVGHATLCSAVNSLTKPGPETPTAT